MSKNLRLAAVRELTGLSRTAILNSRDFPKPFKIGERAIAFDADEVDAWMQSRRAAREAA